MAIATRTGTNMKYKGAENCPPSLQKESGKAKGHSGGKSAMPGQKRKDAPVAKGPKTTVETKSPGKAQPMPSTKAKVASRVMGSHILKDGSHFAAKRTDMKKGDKH